MTINENEAIAKEWIDAFNQHDLKRLLTLYSKEAAHYSPSLELKKPETKGWVKGNEDLEKWWQGSFNDLPGLNYTLKDLTISKSKVFMEYVRKVSGEKDRYVIEYFKIVEGLIVESRVLRVWEIEN